MKLKYYSYYPYFAEDMGRAQDEDTEDARYMHFTQPFRVYYAATCTTKRKVSIEKFLNLVWEVLDMPSCKGIKDYNSPFKLDGVSVNPTQHLYGATNTGDGIYEIDGIYYVKGWGQWHDFEDWKEAVDQVYYYSGSPYQYPMGIDYKKPE